MYNNYRPKNYRKRSYQGRYNPSRLEDRSQSRPKFHPKSNFRNQPFNYRQYNSNGFKAPKQLNTNQQKKRHLKHLRKTAADLAAKKPGSFVYKPGMIGLLRPNTPLNTTQFLSKKVSDFIPKRERGKEEDKDSSKLETRTELNDQNRKCLSMCDEKYQMTNYKPLVGTRTPEPKLSPINFPSDFDLLAVSHYSDNDAYYEDDIISGTMEGLVNDQIFDCNPNIFDTPGTSQENDVIMKQNEGEENAFKISENQRRKDNTNSPTSDCD